MNSLYKVPIYALDELRAFVSSFIPQIFFPSSFLFLLSFLLLLRTRMWGTGGFFFFLHERGGVICLEKTHLTELASRKL